MILRDLVTRLTFKTDATPIKNLGGEISTLKMGLRALGGVAAGAFSALTLNTAMDVTRVKTALKTLLGREGNQEGIPALQEAMKNLRKTGFAGDNEIDRSTMSLLQKGLAITQVAKALELTALHMSASGDSVEGLSEKIGSAMLDPQQATALAVSLRLMDKNAKMFSDIVTNSMLQSSGDLADMIARQRAEVLSKIFADQPEKRKKEQEDLQEGWGKIKGVVSGLDDLWKNISITLFDLVKDTFPKINDLLEKSVEWVRKFRAEWTGWSDFMDNVFLKLSKIPILGRLFTSKESKTGQEADQKESKTGQEADQKEVPARFGLPLPSARGPDTIRGIIDTIRNFLAPTPDKTLGEKKLPLTGESLNHEPVRKSNFVEREQSTDKAHPIEGVKQGAGLREQTQLSPSETRAATQQSPAPATAPALTVHLTVNTQASDPQAVARYTVQELERAWRGAAFDMVIGLQG